MSDDMRQSGNRKPVCIRGVQYPSLSAAARALGLDIMTVSRAARLGILDSVGLTGVQRCPVTIRGVDYPSISAASRALGVSPKTISQAIRDGTTDLIKRVRPPRPSKREVPITIRGVTYPSRTAAARALKINIRTVIAAASAGKENLVGLAHRPRKEVTIRGVSYPSRAAAAQALGVTPGAVRGAELRGALDSVGLRKKRGA